MKKILKKIISEKFNIEINKITLKLNEKYYIKFFYTLDGTDGFDYIYLSDVKKKYTKEQIKEKITGLKTIEDLKVISKQADCDIKGIEKFGLSI